MFAACRHIKSDGIRCQSPAMRQSDFCYFHVKLHTSARGAERRKLKFSAIEDTAGVSIAVSQTLNALIGKRIDAKQAWLALYGIQIMARKIDHHRDSPRDTVRDTIRSQKGDELAPKLCVKEQGWGKSYEDCSECAHRENCGKFENEEEVEEQEQEVAPEAESNEQAENGVATGLTAAAEEYKSPSPSRWHRAIPFKDATDANYLQVLESMSPTALLRLFIKLHPPGSPAS